MTEKLMQIPRDGKGYITDMEELIDKRLDAKIRPFVDVVLHGQEELRRGQKEQNAFLIKTIKHDTWIKAIAASQLFTIFGVFVHWIIGK